MAVVAGGIEHRAEMITPLFFHLFLSSFWCCFSSGPKWRECYLGLWGLVDYLQLLLQVLDGALFAKLASGLFAAPAFNFSALVPALPCLWFFDVACRLSVFSHYLAYLRGQRRLIDLVHGLKVIFLQTSHPFNLRLFFINGISFFSFFYLRFITIHLLEP